MRRLTACLAIVSFVALGTPHSATAQDTTAVAINTKDGTSVFKLAFSIKRVTGEVVDQSNAAVAYASCEACRTIAVAIQVVLVFSDPSVITPENVAIAINEECVSCETLASAYQFVVGTGEMMRFTREGHRALAEIRKAVRDLGRQDLSVEETQAQLDALMAELDEVLATQLVTVQREEEETEPTPSTPMPDDDAPTPPATAEPTPGEESSPTPAESVEAEETLDEPASSPSP